MKVLASLAMKAAYLELVPPYERLNDLKIETQWAGMVDIRKRILAGEVVDAVIGSSKLMEDLVRGGAVDSRSKTDLAKSGIGAAVRKGARKPDIRSLEAFKAALLGAKSIVYSSGPSGVYLAELFQRLGLAEALRGRATQAPPGVLVGELVAKGEYELCFQQLPELRQVAGIEYVGPLPAEVQEVTVFCGGVHSKATQAKAAADWLRHLASPEAEATIRKHGLEPA